MRYRLVLALLVPVLAAAALVSWLGWDLTHVPAPAPFTAAAPIRDDGWGEYHLRTEQAAARRLMQTLKTEIRSLPVK